MFKTASIFSTYKLLTNITICVLCRLSVTRGLDYKSFVNSYILKNSVANV
jgi:hypothetical protein